MKLIDYVESVEVPTDSTNKLRFYFSEQPTLRNKIVINIYAHLAANVSKAPSGRAVVNNLVFHKAFIVLVSKNKEVINRLPLYQFTGYVYHVLPLVIDRTIDWAKSYIEISSIANLSASESFLFTIYCADKITKRVPKGSGLNVEILEIKTTPATIQKFMFPDHENMRGKIINNIEYACGSIVYTPSGDPIVNETVTEKSYLTMVSRGNDIIRKIPLIDFDAGNYDGLRFNFSFKPDLPKCYVECTDTTNLVADEVYLFYLFYWDRIIRR